MFIVGSFDFLSNPFTIQLLQQDLKILALSFDDWDNSQEG
jgi:hypothetical protein